MGEAWGLPELRHVFTIANASREPVRVHRVSSGCDCTSLVPGSFELAPAATQEIAVTIDVGRAPGESVSRTRREFAMPVTFILDDGRVQTIELRGSSAAAFVMDAAIRIDRPLEYGEPAASHRFTIWKDPRIVRLEVSVDPADAEVRELAALGTATSASFDLRPNTQRPLGRFQFDLRVSATAEDGSEFGPLPISVDGQMQSDLAWSPESPLLIWTDAGSPPVEEVAFSSRSGAFSIEVTGAMEGVAAEFDQADSQRDPAARRLRLSGVSMPQSRTYGMVLLSASCGDHHGMPLAIPVAVQPLIAVQPQHPAASRINIEDAAPQDEGANP